MVLVAGLGNPGTRYIQTRHNIGFLVLERWAERLNATFKGATRFQGELCEAVACDDKALLLKPQTYMNLSGRSVAAVMRFYKLSPDALIVVHDEVDLAFGCIRLKFGGGLAGHNGLKSIANTLGTKDFIRIRFGVGRPPGKMDMADHVLSKFSKAEQGELPLLIEDAIDGLEAVLRDGVKQAMNRINAR